MTFGFFLQTLKISCFLMLLLIYLPTDAQEKDVIADSNRDRKMRTPEEMVKSFLQKEQKASAYSTMQNNLLEDSRLDSAKLKAWNSYYSYMYFGYIHRKNVFNWQLLSSKFIFFVVIALVLVGVYFAWIQFYYTLRSIKKSGSSERALSTELTASFKEVKIVSPVLGVIILMISFLFFYLYLRYVYPINELF